jgi:hypothetical protein
MAGGGNSADSARISPKSRPDRSAGDILDSCAPLLTEEEGDLIERLAGVGCATEGCTPLRGAPWDCVAVIESSHRSREAPHGPIGRIPLPLRSNKAIWRIDPRIN